MGKMSNKRIFCGIERSGSKYRRGDDLSFFLRKGYVNFAGEEKGGQFKCLTNGLCVETWIKWKERY
jgi:hypothetical protein